MSPIFMCPKCSEQLNKFYSCSNCSKTYFNEEGFFDFLNDSLSSIENTEIELSEILSKIHSQGYSRGLLSFLKNNPEFEYRFNRMEGGIAFRVIRKNNTRCLILNSDLGNIPENLSQVFDEVYSLDVNKEKILIQKHRFRETDINNVILIRSDVMNLPFPNIYFDLIVSNGIKIGKSGKRSSKTKVIDYFKEIKRILTPDGCLCVSVDNKYGLKLYRKEINYGISDETFSDSFYGYSSIFRSLGFQIEPYWVLPSYKKPHYSGKIEDGISLKWFFSNFNRFLFNKRKFALIELFLKKTNTTTSKQLTKLLCPYFLFYCYNEKTPKILEGMIIEKTGFKNFIQCMRSRKVMYILLDRFGNPSKVLSFKNARYDLTEEIIPLKRDSFTSKYPEEKIVIEDWLEDNSLDRLNSNDINLVMRWLIDFQKNTESELFTQQEIDDEINNLKRDLGKIEEMLDLPYHKWLDEYKEHISSIKLKKTRVHGDLQPRNILVNRKNSTITVIDWELSIEKGSPLIDFLWFATSIMNWSINNVDEFRANLNGVGKAIPSLKIIKETMNKHFQVDLNFIILLRYVILRWISVKTKGLTTLYLTYIEFLKILDDKNCFPSLI